MTLAIAGGTGLIGKAIVQNWLSQGKKVLVLGRSKERIQKVFANNVEAVTYDECAAAPEQYFREVACIVNLAGANIADKRWTASRKASILNSRVKITKHISAICAKLAYQKITLINASAVGVYGLQPLLATGLPERLDEGTPLLQEHAETFLEKVCFAWEEATRAAKDAGVRVVNARLGVVLAKEGGALQKMALPFYMFAGGPMGSGRQALAWISLKDVIRAMDFLLEEGGISGPVNLVAPECLTQKNFAGVLGRVLHRPSFMPTPGVILKIALGQMAEELLLNGAHVYPARLIQAGFTFQYPHAQAALQDIYS
ncbi:MAG: TIGR01777 family oxidoreductase [Candidatus Omnitrophica bacterium]|nr:TIGR01777 family oxidoreductase [Candidatus Omnitrophota bacterium]